METFYKEIEEKFITKTPLKNEELKKPSFEHSSNEELKKPSSEHSSDEESI